MYIDSYNTEKQSNKIINIHNLVRNNIEKFFFHSPNKQYLYLHAICMRWAASVSLLPALFCFKLPVFVSMSVVERRSSVLFFHIYYF